MLARLNASVAGQFVFEPKPSASRWYGVRAIAGPPAAGEDRQDRDVLAELAEARDQPAARAARRRPGGARRRRGSCAAEDTGCAAAASGRPRPPHRPGYRASRPRRRAARRRTGPSDHSRQSASPRRSTTIRLWSSRGPTGMTSRRPSASCSRSGSGMDGAPAVTTMPSHGAAVRRRRHCRRRPGPRRRRSPSAASRRRGARRRARVPLDDRTVAPSLASTAAW